MNKKSLLKRMLVFVLALVLGSAPVFMHIGPMKVQAAGAQYSFARGGYNNWGQVVGKWYYDDGNGNKVYNDNADLLKKLPYKQNTNYRYTTLNYNKNNGAFDTSNWATSFMWDLTNSNPYSMTVYAIPFAFRAGLEGGASNVIQITAPSSLSDVANNVYKMDMPANGSLTDFAVQPDFSTSCAKVDAITDWTYDIVMEDASDSSKYLKTTMVQGSIFAYFELVGDTGLTVLRPRSLPAAVAYQNDNVLVIRCMDNMDGDYDYYAFYGAQGTTYNVATNGNMINSIDVSFTNADRTYMSIAYLGSNPVAPNDSWGMNMAQAYLPYAYNFVTDTKATYSYNPANSTVTTTYTYTVAKKPESTADGTIMGVLPHQYKNMSAGTNFLDYKYATIRGTMKTIAGNSFSTSLKYSGILPFMPDYTEDMAEDTEEEAAIANYLKDFTDKFSGDYFANYEGSGDTYWDGKGLNRLANAMSAAEAAGDEETAREMYFSLKNHLNNWFTYSGKNDDRYFYYDKDLGALFGFPQSYSSVDQINDHHFHYGYFIYSAAQVAMREQKYEGTNEWASQYGGMVEELIGDIACATRNNPDSRYPYMRNFAPYEGHSWASGHSNFEMGNNQESSSEALNAWAGIILWGEATGNTTIRDLGIYLYATEISAVENYWYDVEENVLSDAYRYGVTNAEIGTIDKNTAKVKNNSAAIVWGGSYTYATWFSANPLYIQGINLLPMNPTCFYLAGDKDYIQENWDLAYEKAAAAGWDLESWVDIWCQYYAMAYPEAAISTWKNVEEGADSYGVEGGDTKAHTYHFMKTMDVYGTPDTTVTSNNTLGSVFVKDGVKTYCAYNPTAAEKKVTFSDGYSVTVPARSMEVETEGKSATQAQYTIKHFLEGVDGSFAVDESLSQKLYGEKDETVTITEETATEVPGYDFDADNENNQMEITVAADGSSVIKLYYTRKEYNITYELNGGTNAPGNPATYKYKDSITLQEPEKAGYKFTGWYTSPALQTEVTHILETDMGDKVLYAGWQDPYVYELDASKKITFEDGKIKVSVTGADSDDTVLIHAGFYADFDAAKNITTDNGVAGLGGYPLVYNEENNTWEYTFTNGFSVGQYMVFRINVIKDGVGDLSAWGLYEIPSEEDETAIAYYENTYLENMDGTYALSSSVKKKAADGETVTFAENAPTGFVFDESQDNVISATITKGETVTLKRYYKRLVYDITYNLNGGTNHANNPASYKYGSTINLEAPTKAEFTFAGWFTNEACTQAFAGIKPATTGAITLWAKWVEIGEEPKDPVDPEKPEFGGYTYADGKVTFYYKEDGINSGILYMAMYDDEATALQIAEAGNAAADEGFGAIVGHGGYNLSLNNDRLEYSHPMAEGKYFVYGFKPGTGIVEQWYVGCAKAENGGGGSEDPKDPVNPEPGNPEQPENGGYNYADGTVTIWTTRNDITTVYIAVYDDLTAAQEKAEAVNAYIAANGGDGFGQIDEEKPGYSFGAADGEGKKTCNITLEAGKGFIYCFAPNPNKWYAGVAAASGGNEPGGGEKEKTTAYTITHYIQNTSKTGFDVKETENGTGTVGDTVTATPKTYTGFTHDNTVDGTVLTGTLAEEETLQLSVYYTRNTYSITYANMDGAENNENNPATFIYGVGATLHAPTKAGAEFGGWYLDSGFTQAISVISTECAEPVVVYAKWNEIVDEPANYVVKYYLETLTESKYAEVLEDRVTGTDLQGKTITAQEKEYTGFALNEEVEGTCKSGVLSAEGDLILKLYYDREEYEITYHNVDDAVNPDSNKAAYTFGKGFILADASKENAIFCGWYSDAECSPENQVTAITDAQSGNVDLYAAWEAEPAEYTVKYYLQDTSLEGYVEAEAFVKTSSVGTEINALDEGYDISFEGFLLNKKISVLEGTVSKEPGLELKLYYDRVKYTITYENIDDATNHADNPDMYVYGIGTPLFAPEKEGYAFLGWYTDEDFAESSKMTEVTPDYAGDIILFAKWVEEEQAVSYSVEYYFQDTAKKNYVKDENAGYTANGLIGSDVAAQEKTFTGFMLNKDVKGTVENGTITEGETLVLKLYYDRMSYAITYANMEDAINHADNADTYLYGVGLTLGNPEKQNYIFEGWFKEAGFENAITEITSAQAEDVTVFAKWKAYEPEVEDDGDDEDGFTVDNIAPQYYTGSKITPSIIVKDGDRILTNKTDYTVSFKNNVKVGDATVTITGKGNYAGKVQKTFKILPASISDEDFAVSDIYVAYKANKTTKVAPKLTRGKTTLKLGKDYRIEGVAAYGDIGEHPVKLVGMGNYCGDRTIQFVVTDRVIMSKVSIKKIANQYYNDGKEINPNIVVSYKGDVLTQGHDYDLDITNNCNTGTATVVVTGKPAAGFIGTKQSTFKIMGTDLKKMEFDLEDDEFEYTGSSILPKYYSGKLSAGKDFTVAYAKNVNVGKATVTFSGMGAYSGKVTKTFKIAPYNIANNGANLFEDRTGDINVEFLKGGNKPEVNLYFNGKELVAGTDYTVSYKNNTKVGEGTITIKGKGKLTGTITKSFNIVANDMDNVLLMPEDIVAKSGKNAAYYMAKLNVTDADGKKLAAKKDYDDKKIVYTYTVNGETKVFDKNSVIGDLPEGTVLSVTIYGINGYKDAVKTAEYRVVKNTVKSAKVTIPAQTYTGSEVTLDSAIAEGKVTVTVSGKPATFEIVEGSYLNNVKKGTAKVTIHGTGDFGGYKTVSFKIGQRNLLDIIAGN